VSKPFTISIIIPAYNEAETIQPCLDAIAAQTVRPHEVIVVDNNSTDTTAALAARYPFVRVIYEQKQGVVHARNTGFDAATGDILGRIDADSIIAADWVETLHTIFVSGGPDAVSGSVTYHSLPYVRFWNGVDYVFRRYFAWALGREYALQGANMALRSKAWRKTKHSICNAGGLHEDFDLAIHLREQGHKTVFTPRLLASLTFRQAGSRWRDYLSYVMLHSGTYAQHKRLRRVVMYPIMLLAIVFYPLIRMLYLGYDAPRDTFSFSKFLRTQAGARVNPATFVD